MVSELPNANVGTVFGLIVTSNVVIVAHCPAVGVNVYVPEVVLSTVDGLHVPVIPFDDVVGSVGTLAPAQAASAVPKLKVGVTFGFTVTVSVAVNAHCPGSGVNVYVPDVVLSILDGLHVPVILLLEVFGKAGTAAPLHIVIEFPKAKVGVTFGVTVSVKLKGTAHAPAVGVNVYVPVLVLLTLAGFHVPVTPLLEVFGSVGTAPPEQIVDDPKLNVGVTFGLTVTLNEAVVAH